MNEFVITLFSSTRGQPGTDDPGFSYAQNLGRYGNGPQAPDPPSLIFPARSSVLPACFLTMSRKLAGGLCACATRCSEQRSSQNRLTKPEHSSPRRSPQPAMAEWRYCGRWSEGEATSAKGATAALGPRRWTLSVSRCQLRKLLQAGHRSPQAMSRQTRNSLFLKGNSGGRQDWPGICVCTRYFEGVKHETCL